MAPNIQEIAKSPVLMVGVAGVALVGGVYFYQKRAAPQQVVTGGTLPFSWDALASWINETYGQGAPPPGPGPAPAPGPTPTPNPIPTPHLCPPGSHWDSTLNTCVSDAQGCAYGSCNGIADAIACGPGLRCINGCCQPAGPPQGGQQPVGGASDMPTGNHDVAATETPVAPVQYKGPGQPRIIGYSPEVAYRMRYQLAHAIMSTDGAEEGVLGGH